MNGRATTQFRLWAIQRLREREQTEAALKEREKAFRSLFDTGTNAVALLVGRRFQRVNSLMSQITGYTEAELLGQTTRIHYPDEAEYERVGRELYGAMERDEVGVLEARHRRKNGELYDFLLYARRLNNEAEGKATLVTVQDIIEKKQLEANFLRAQRMEGIGALGGGIAHDLNNILQPILMSARLLREETTDPESREMLETVASSAQRGADIIKQLLTFARGTPGTRVPLPVRHLLHELEKIIRETFPRNIQLGMEAAQDPWLVMGDATQIHQALMNLCVNARDAMPDGGRLTLAAANVTLDTASAATTPDAKPGRHVCVSVTDTGTGIPPEVLDRIFDPFFTTKELGNGTGLGLATVLGILRGHGGFVRVKSQPGQGSSFDVPRRYLSEPLLGSGFPARPIKSFQHRAGYQWYSIQLVMVVNAKVISPGL